MSATDIQPLDERASRMPDEIGHVCVRLFKTAQGFKVNSLAYMCRQLSHDEAQTLTQLWNNLENYLRTIKPKTKGNDYDE